MGGFEGGDEAGFWDIEAHIEPVFASQKSKHHAPPHHVIEVSEGYVIPIYIDENHQIGTLHCLRAPVFIEGLVSVESLPERIKMVYRNLLEVTQDFEIDEFFSEHSIHIEISKECDPLMIETASAVAFLLLSKEVCSLLLNRSELESIVVPINAKASLVLNAYLT